MKIKSLIFVAVAAFALVSGVACQSTPSDPSFKEPTAAEKAAKAQRGGAINAAQPGGGTAPAAVQTTRRPRTLNSPQ